MGFREELEYLRQQTPLTARVAEAVRGRDLRGVRVAFSVHLDLKTVPVIEAVLAGGAQVLVVSCNPATVRDEVCSYLAEQGAQVRARRGMRPEEWEAGFAWALRQGPHYLCEMGADLSTRAARDRELAGPVRAAMEATGTGVQRLQQAVLPFPVLDWNALPLKEGLHNRHLVGLVTWITFLDVARVTLYGKRVAVLGYGPVGQGVAEYARLLGALPVVVELRPDRQLLARHAGCEVQELERALPRADVVVTATGRDGVLREEHFHLLRDGAFLLNVGHSNQELDTEALRRHPTRCLRPHLEEVRLPGRRVYLLAGGAMFNLAAGGGDPYDAFDLTAALLLAGLQHLLDQGHRYPPGLHPMPAEVEHRVAYLARQLHAS
ncbi:MAG: adenosylhomocysteinase [Armatimonadota bacterium]|nr:adenosylhomocysteinase [Armatimonadota bacterium]MDW8156704.1 adenosylhomocysteinase [Armatimonadota bacterium]